MMVKATSSYVYYVYESGRRYIVDIDRGTCNYCRLNTIIRTYELPIVPMPNMKDLNVPEFVYAEEVLPSKYKRPPSRPKKGRHLKSNELLIASSNHCCKCRHAGHNHRTYNYFPKEG
ncbi:uncharacterized protein LOC124898495 [Capsicum annuum]|uniref:uncharacterized protein LOC124898495 n=1 Tax=Capsicum annuum TaxID=4072 RepID=UPI001FB07B21|nr:uncharacterized protein LOC124898495 [Capsicum annuum]